MRLTRRDGLKTLTGLSVGSSALFAGGSAAWGEEAWPFTPSGRRPAVGAGSKRVVAHWHGFRVSTKNEPPETDSYTRGYLRPEGLDGRFADAGGYMRERPLPRPARTGRDWLVQDMAEEIRLATAAGIDAFEFNIVDINPKSTHWQNYKTLLDAAGRVDNGFTIIAAVDALVLRKADPKAIGAAIASTANSKAIARTEDGRLMIGAFLAEQSPLAWWETLFAEIETDGRRVFFMPGFLNAGKIASSDLMDRSDGISLWGINTLPGLGNLDRVAATARAKGKLWMAPIVPQDFRPKKKVYFEAGNTRLFRQSWQHALQSDAAWTKIITWNDYSEASEIAPSTGIQWAFYDLTAYYGAWFKAGTQPKITKDVLYYNHRVQPAGLAAGDAVAAESRFTLRGAKESINEVELLAFLTEPGRLEIELAGTTAGRDAPAGITAFTVPLQPGTPRFRLRRGDRTVIDFSSAFPIAETLRYPDLLYRAGSSSRAPVPMLALPNI